MVRTPCRRYSSSSPFSHARKAVSHQALPEHRTPPAEPKNDHQGRVEERCMSRTRVVTNDGREEVVRRFVGKLNSMIQMRSVSSKESEGLGDAERIGSTGGGGVDGCRGGQNGAAGRRGGGCLCRLDDSEKKEEQDDILHCYVGAEEGDGCKEGKNVEAFESGGNGATAERDAESSNTEDEVECQRGWEETGVEEGSREYNRSREEDGGDDGMDVCWHMKACFKVLDFLQLPSDAVKIHTTQNGKCWCLCDVCSAKSGWTHLSKQMFCNTRSTRPRMQHSSSGSRANVTTARSTGITRMECGRRVSGSNMRMAREPVTEDEEVFTDTGPLPISWSYFPVSYPSSSTICSKKIIHNHKATLHKANTYHNGFHTSQHIRSPGIASPQTNASSPHPPISSISQSTQPLNQHSHSMSTLSDTLPTAVEAASACVDRGSFSTVLSVQALTPSPPASCTSLTSPPSPPTCPCPSQEHQPAFMRWPLSYHGTTAAGARAILLDGRLRGSDGETIVSRPHLASYRSTGSFGKRTKGVVFAAHRRYSCPHISSSPPAVTLTYSAALSRSSSLVESAEVDKDRDLGKGEVGGRGEPTEGGSGGVRRKSYFTSPSPKYAGMVAYATPFQLLTSSGGDGSWWQVMLEVRVRPGTYATMPQTLLKGHYVIDPHVPNEKIAWRIPDYDLSYSSNRRRHSYEEDSRHCQPPWQSATPSVTSNGINLCKGANLFPGADGFPMTDQGTAEAWEAQRQGTPVRGTPGEGQSEINNIIDYTETQRWSDRTIDTELERGSCSRQDPQFDTHRPPVSCSSACGCLSCHMPNVVTGIYIRKLPAVPTALETTSVSSNFASATLGSHSNLTSTVDNNHMLNNNHKQSDPTLLLQTNRSNNEGLCASTAASSSHLTKGCREHQQGISKEVHNQRLSHHSRTGGGWILSYFLPCTGEKPGTADGKEGDRGATNWEGGKGGGRCSEDNEVWEGRGKYGLPSTHQAHHWQWWQPWDGSAPFVIVRDGDAAGIQNCSDTNSDKRIDGGRSREGGVVLVRRGVGGRECSRDAVGGVECMYLATVVEQPQGRCGCARCRDVPGG
eukprot:GHVQ01007868.1.p1 GENE.GHVQ01007868.1~~GHVQ01007868.1.p1  ORF type:complete len:1074 (+),score=203.49 GHVQ01007868.1:512-3733(+)